MVYHVALGKIEESVMLEKRILKPRALNRLNHDVRSDAATAINRPAAIGELYFTASGLVVIVAVKVVVIERDVGIIPLDQPATRGVILGGGQSQSCVF